MIHWGCVIGAIIGGILSGFAVGYVWYHRGLHEGIRRMRIAVGESGVTSSKIDRIINR